MSTIDLSTVSKTARLARLAVTDAELAEYEAHFARLLDFVQDVIDAPIDDVEPLAHPLDLAQRLRPDEVTEADRRDALQTVAPQVDDGFYLVPRVIE